MIEEIKLAFLTLSAVVAALGVVKIIRNRELHRPRILVGPGKSGPNRKDRTLKRSRTKTYAPWFIVCPMPTKADGLCIASIPMFVLNIGERKSGSALLFVRFPRAFLPDGKSIKRICELGEPDGTHEEGIATDGHVFLSEDLVSVRHEIPALFVDELRVIEEFVQLKPRQEASEKVVDLLFDDEYDARLVRYLKGSVEAAIPFSVTVHAEDATPTVYNFLAVYLEGDSQEGAAVEWTEKLVVASSMLDSTKNPLHYMRTRKWNRRESLIEDLCWLTDREGLNVSHPDRGKRPLLMSWPEKQKWWSYKRWTRRVKSRNSAQ